MYLACENNINVKKMLLSYPQELYILPYNIPVKKINIKFKLQCTH